MKPYLAKVWVGSLTSPFISSAHFSTIHFNQIDPWKTSSKYLQRDIFYLMLYSHNKEKKPIRHLKNYKMINKEIKLRKNTVSLVMNRFLAQPISAQVTITNSFINSIHFNPPKFSPNRPFDTPEYYCYSTILYHHWLIEQIQIRTLESSLIFLCISNSSLFSWNR